MTAAGQPPARQMGPVLYPDPAGLTVAELFATLDASMWADLADHLTDREAEAIGTALEAMGLHHHAAVLHAAHTSDEEGS